MRLGLNPFKDSNADQAEEVTVALTTFIPHLSGYFAERLQLLELCIESIRQHTDLPHDLFVFDNGSCPKVRDYLKDLSDRNIIQYTLFSRKNLGVLGAFNVIAAAAPGRYIAYSDDDIFFYPGWLSVQLDILKAYPRVGMVSGLPTWKNCGRYIDSTHRLAQATSGVSVEMSRGWPAAWVADYCTGTGRDPKQYDELCREIDVWKLKYMGVSAIATCSHCQFVVEKEALRSLLPFETEGRSFHMNPLDGAVNAAGLMRLSTPEPYVFHMGNRVSPRVRELTARYGLPDLPSEGDTDVGVPAFFEWLLRRWRVRKLLRKSYGKLFEWLLVSDGRLDQKGKKSSE